MLLYDYYKCFLFDICRGEEYMVKGLSKIIKSTTSDESINKFMRKDFNAKHDNSTTINHQQSEGAGGKGNKPASQQFWTVVNSVPLKVKLWGSFIIVLLFLVSISLVSFKNINQLNEQMLYIGNTQVQKTQIIGDLKEEVNNIRQNAAKHAYERGSGNKVIMENFINKDIEKSRKNIKSLTKLIDSDSDKKLLEDFNKNFEKMAEFLPSFYEGSRTNDYSISDKQMKLLAQNGGSTIVALDRLDQNVNKSTSTLVKNSEADSTESMNEIIIVSLIGVVLSVIILFFLTRLISRSVYRVAKNVDISNGSVEEIKNSIERTAISAQELDTSMNKANDSINALVASIQQVAAGTDVTTDSVDEISAAVEQMSASINIVAGSADYLNATAEETSAAIQEMMASIEQVAGNAGDVSNSVELFATRIEEMSKSISGVSDNAVSLTQTAEETAETIEEMVVSIKQIAGSTHKVNDLAISVKQDALEGELSINETLNFMSEISQVIKQGSHIMENLGKNSEEIGMIVKVIDDIADQTNLLALNAAIEAARAGEHGKGFAVVADEVRKLAERSAKATKEISKIIKGIQKETSTAIAATKEGSKKVELGNQLADKTNLAIKKISEGISQVTEEMNQIAKATEEQTRNSQFITQAVENVTQQTNVMTHSTKEQSVTADRIAKGILHAKELVNQITIATAEQAKGTSAIVSAVESVTTQSNSVTNATKEQALTAEEIVRNITHMKDMVMQMATATNEQAKYGKDIAIEVENVRKQTEELNDSIETQSKEVNGVAGSIHDVKVQIEKLK
jgi:methyl-accepting chemotaxis protein